MINKTEKEEREFLEEIKDKLEDEINRTDGNMNSHSKDVQEFKDYLWENRSGMDHAEKVSIRQSITQTALTGESAAAKKKRLQKLLTSPYFGRIDFTEAGSREYIPVYIGIHSFFDPDQHANLIHDWRAPVSSMFYDFELGEAGFDSPSGEINGEITLKRQYRIREGKMDFMLESSLNIHDDILQQELSRSTDEKMKNIVATIQRDQNAIIRNDSSQVLIIQGVAGSGKTSIALHRIAYLLYRFKDTISSKDILIISPNKVFADYISNVLPELGEEKIGETGMEELAGKLLANKYRFGSFFDQVARLLEKEDRDFIRRIEFKASKEILNKLNQYVTHIENEFFVPNDLKVGRYYVPYTFVAQKFMAFSRVPLFKRFAVVASQVADFLRFTHQQELKAPDVKKIENDIKKMLKISNLRDLYKNFYTWLGRPELFKNSRSGFEYQDVFPLIYLKIRLEGIKTENRVKHLIIDEMQDYTPVQYAVITRFFTCKKTILGDTNQSVNPFGSSTAEDIQKVFVNADMVKLCKSYRSTYEITEFAQSVSRNDDLVAIERHGYEPGLYGFSNTNDEINKIVNLAGDFEGSKDNSLGIICKTQKQADHLYEQLKQHLPKIYLLNSQSVSFVNGIVITTAHLSKGLEFDQVIVPFASEQNYKTVIGNRMLYIACTRAMHRLNITFTGKKSLFLNEVRVSSISGT